MEEAAMADDRQDEGGNLGTRSNIVSSSDDKKTTDLSDLVIKTDGQFEGVVSG
jgi:hypothetical protein